MPEFAPVMNKIMGNYVCVIPMHKDTLTTMKNILKTILNLKES